MAGALITGEEFGQLFQSFKYTARRLEGRGRYNDPEEEVALQRFLNGQAEDQEYVADRDYWLDGTVRPAVAAGKIFQRVRLVADPLTQYQRFGLRNCRDNVAAGEDIRYLTRAEANRLDLPDHDYWLFDGQLAMLWFTHDDRLLGAQWVADQEVTQQHEQWLNTALNAAAPYGEFLAADPSRDRPGVR
jgi:hypothetical protein